MTRIPDHKVGIMVHCLATRPSWSKNRGIIWILDQVTKWHVVENGWRAVAYARIYGRNGSWINGRDLDADGDVWEETGAGARGWNRNWIHLALDGGHGSTANDDPLDHFTQPQLDSLRHDIDEIQRMAGRKLEVKGHNEVANKACPGFNVKRWYYKKTPARESVAQSTSVQAGGAGVATAVGGGITAVGSLDGNAQIVALIVCGVAALLFMYLIRERLTKWARGVR